MPHGVVFNVPNRNLGKEDVLFDVYDDDGKVGALRISKGGVDWRPAWSKLAYRARWETFNAVMTENITGRRTTG